MQVPPSDLHGGAALDLDSRVRFEQQRVALQGEVANAKQRYLKKLSALEKQLEQARTEKRELQS